MDADLTAANGSPEKSAFAYDELLSSMGAGAQASTELDPVVMSQDVEILKGRLRSMNKGLIDPRSKMMTYWDFFTLSALLFTSTVTPFEVCLIWEEKKFWEPDWFNALFVINWIVNIIFMIDICFNFFLPYKESIKKGGGTVKSHRRIMMNYLTSWFPVDFVSVIPVDNIMMAVDTENLRGASVLGAIRMLRLLRLLKLARILRASRIFSRWENQISMSYSNRALIFWFCMVLFVLHSTCRLLHAPTPPVPHPLFYFSLPPTPCRRARLTPPGCCRCCCVFLLRALLRSQCLPACLACSRSSWDHLGRSCWSSRCRPRSTRAMRVATAASRAVPSARAASASPSASRPARCKSSRR